MVKRWNKLLVHVVTTSVNDLKVGTRADKDLLPNRPTPCNAGFDRTLSPQILILPTNRNHLLNIALLPVSSMWFIQVQRGLRVAFVNPNQAQIILRHIICAICYFRTALNHSSRTALRGVYGN